MNLLLPTDVALLRSLRQRPTPVGSRSITARQRKLLVADGMIVERRVPEYFNWNCFVITEAGLSRLASYETVTLSETFK